ncbi:hypothetical protein AMJ85_05270, partial [candidate division BRC1 bacterium SM23_51]
MDLPPATRSGDGPGRGMRGMFENAPTRYRNKSVPYSVLIETAPGSGEFEAWPGVVCDSVTWGMDEADTIATLRVVLETKDLVDSAGGSTPAPDGNGARHLAHFLSGDQVDRRVVVMQQADPFSILFDGYRIASR